eukprot:257398-Rhodomonas_salina.1
MRRNPTSLRARFAVSPLSWKQRHPDAGSRMHGGLTWSGGGSGFAFAFWWVWTSSFDSRISATGDKIGPCISPSATGARECRAARSAHARKQQSAYR